MPLFVIFPQLDPITRNLLMLVFVLILAAVAILAFFIALRFSGVWIRLLVRFFEFIQNKFGDIGALLIIPIFLMILFILYLLFA